MASTAPDPEPEGQSLYAEEEEEVNPDPNEFDQRPPECTPFGVTPTFELVSNFFEKLQDMRGKRTAKGARGSTDKKRDSIQRIFSGWRAEVSKDLYPLSRLLLPERDRYRATYGTKEQVLAKIYINVLNLAPHSTPADRLLKWKQPTRESQASGDFAEVAFAEIAARSTVEKCRMSIEEVNNKLDELSQTTKLDQKCKIMSTLNENLTAQDQKWLIRIILKDLKISLGEKMVLSCIHQDAIDLFNVCSDLRAVCWKLWDTSKRLPNEDNTVHLFRAFRPMLCNRVKNDFDEIVKAMGSSKKNPKPFLIEEKLDGERIQLHKRGEEYRYFSRKDKDYTYLYGLDRTSTDGALTPFIHDCFASDLEEIILDGEMVVRDPNTDRYLKFGTLKTTAINQWKGSGGPTVTYKVFDVLHAKLKDRPAKSLLEHPLSQRREVLRKFVKPKKARIEVAEELLGTGAKDIKDRMAWILEKAGEGLVIKNLDSSYTLHGREDDWIKVKPEYMDSLGEEVDVLVMGGFWGSGRRGGTIGSFMCGVLDEQDDGPRRFLSFCKVGSGFSMEDFESIAQHFNGKARDWVKGMSDPDGYIFGAEKPDVWYKPEDSVLIAVKAAEITADATNYGAEVCLRFPRAQKIRWDLKPEDCHRYQVDFLTMATSNRSKTIAHDFTRKRKIASRSNKATILASMQAADVTGVKEQSDTFQDTIFYVVEGLTEDGKPITGYSKQDLEKLIVAHGGKRWSTVPKQEDSIIICGRTNFLKAKQISKQGRDLIHPQWILDCIEHGRRLSLAKKYFAYMTPGTAKEQGADNSADDDEEDEEHFAAAPLFNRDFSSSPEVPPLKKSKQDNGRKKGTSGALTQQDDASSTEATDASTEYASEADENTNIARTAVAASGSTKANTQDLSPELPSNDKLDQDIAKSGLGASTNNNDYDQEQIFTDLIFYLDTASNALRNNLLANTQDANDSDRDDKHLMTVGQSLKAAGGRLVTDLKEPSLTHVIVGLDTSRVRELSRRTREPRARRLVTANWVEDCIEQETLLEESWYPVYADA